MDSTDHTLPERPSKTFMVIGTKLKQNIGTIVRCAVGFGIDTLVVIGSHKFGTHGAHGSQKFIRIMHFFYWENFVRYAKDNGIRIVGISPGVSSYGDRTTVSLDAYSFSASEKYAFCVFPSPLGMRLHDYAACDDVLHVDFPGGSEKASLILYDTTVSICFMKYRVQTGNESVETKMIDEKFVLGQQRIKSGIIFMDTETARPLEETCGDSEEFGFSLFGGDNDETAEGIVDEELSSII